jgi:hypothetical protein
LGYILKREVKVEKLVDSSWKALNKRTLSPVLVFASKRGKRKNG